LAKEFTFKGKTIEELEKMPLEEYAKLCESNIRRSIIRGIEQEDFKKVLKKVKDAKAGKRKSVRTHLREFPVIPEMVGVTMGVHKGNEFVNVEIKPQMLGHRLGEFALTRKRLLHGKAGIGATRSSTAIATRK
jgi:small subunit ribosomal protein S19